MSNNSTNACNTVRSSHVWFIEGLGPSQIYSVLRGIMMNGKGAILIVFAWLMEAVGVIGGIASVLLSKHRGIKMVAITGIVVLGYLAVENWTFGFERIVDMRSAQVKEAHLDLDKKEAEVKWLTEQSLNAGAGLTPQQQINADFSELERQRQQPTEPTFAAYPPGQTVAPQQLPGIGEFAPARAECSTSSIEFLDCIKRSAPAS